MSDCRVCGSPVVKPEKGRPPKYCGEVCRRSMEFKIRRLDRAIERLWKRRDEQELKVVESSGHRRHVDVFEAIEAQIERAEGELREALDD